MDRQERVGDGRGPEEPGTDPGEADQDGQHPREHARGEDAGRAPGAVRAHPAGGAAAPSARQWPGDSWRADAGTTGLVYSAPRGVLAR